MMPANVIVMDIQRALSLVTTLLEGGIDPDTSRWAQGTMLSLHVAQRALEGALVRSRRIPADQAARPPSEEPRHA